eukprot:scaffold35177_cov161-Skeletonema_dohrnii-CCMP3373.AAC.2
MKIQIVFLSLLAAAHARHEPKGLRGGDEHDLELVGYTVVPNGSSATINCGSGSQCCVTVTGSFEWKINTGIQQFGGSCQEPLSNGSLTLSKCKESTSCSVSCDGNCNVAVKAGSGSAGLPGRAGSPGGYGNNGGHDYSGYGWPKSKWQWPPTYGWPGDTRGRSGTVRVPARTGVPVPYAYGGAGAGRVGTAHGSGRAGAGVGKGGRGPGSTRQINHIISRGKSASIQCGSGSQCCVTGSFKTTNSVGSMTIGGGGSCQAYTMSNGSLSNCQSNLCSVSCDESCSVRVPAGYDMDMDED